MDVDASGIMSRPIPKRRKATCPQCSGCSAKNSRTANTRSASCNPNTSRDSNSSGDTISSDSSTSSSSLLPVLPFTITETINVLEHMLAGEEDVVDLTCEGTEPAAVVDLTNNDSVVVLRAQRELQRATWSAVTRRRRMRGPCSMRICCPRCRPAVKPGRLQGPSAVQCVWTRTQRSWTPAGWWSLPSAAMSFAASASGTRWPTRILAQPAGKN
ncbi:E3 ubiquitin-protein ligase RNF4 isoform X2 [Gadus morhua]|uniref:E3 ubiquitin-protein ligase RNF4 isoform X2 n=1 Tax=Gadus morhua TaxID=8049 RepID=UPI0011B4F768|nr:E3 ubiquitin-protein ligase RNF4 isoform X2 [Gadus morhua]